MWWSGSVRVRVIVVSIYILIYYIYINKCLFGVLLFCIGLNKNNRYNNDSDFCNSVDGSR